MMLVLDKLKQDFNGDPRFYDLYTKVVWPVDREGDTIDMKLLKAKHNKAIADLLHKHREYAKLVSDEVQEYHYDLYSARDAVRVKDTKIKRQDDTIRRLSEQLKEMQK
jgi:hypothetical protein